MQTAIDLCTYLQYQGKTVVSSWLVRQQRVRQQFSKILWVTLGQTPDISEARSALYVQLTGRPFPENTSDAETKVLLAQAMSASQVINSASALYKPACRSEALDDRYCLCWMIAGSVATKME